MHPMSSGLKQCSWGLELHHLRQGLLRTIIPARQPLRVRRLSGLGRLLGQHDRRIIEPHTRELAPLAANN